jgi:hypothetical protein
VGESQKNLEEFSSSDEDGAAGRRSFFKINFIIKNNKLHLLQKYIKPV